MSYITNIDTLSTLFDRLISENIKLFFFEKDDLTENINHQKEVIKKIKFRIFNLMIETYESTEYNYIGEKRTYNVDAISESLEELIKFDILTGEGDRANLEEAQKPNPDPLHFSNNHKKLRKANELRAVTKNKIDEQYKDLIEGEPESES